MNNHQMTTDELRGMLDEYTPEQQMEIDAKAVIEGAKAIAGALSQISACLDRLPPLIATLQQATRLHISEDTISAIEKAGHDAGERAAAAFKQSVHAAIAEARRSVSLVSLPACIAFVLLFLLLSLAAFSGIVVYINLTVWHNPAVWRALWIAAVFFASSVAMLALLRHMEWI